MFLKRIGAANIKVKMRSDSMERLINADNFRRFCHEQLDKTIYTVDEILEMIDIQQTAYDVEKVVEQLENLEPFHVDGYGDDFVNLYDAIEIVVGAGTDDVCEWKLEYEGRFIINPHTNRGFSNEESMKNVYCNTCGKKIKVVE